MLPTFVVIGSTKGGTTALYNYLKAHPQVFMSTPKELRFFSRDERWRRGTGWYEGHFADAADAVARGDCTPEYTAGQRVGTVPARMASVVPDAKLIYLVRHPVDRIVSHYQHRRTRGREHRPPSDALRDAFYVDTSRYATALDRYLEHFDRSAIQVVMAERLRTEREPTLRRVYEFVGVDPGILPPDIDIEHNVAERIAPRVPRSRVVRSALRHAVALGLSPHTARRLSDRGIEAPPPARVEVPDDVRAELEDLLRDEVARLRPWLGAELDAWSLA